MIYNGFSRSLSNPNFPALPDDTNRRAPGVSRFCIWLSGIDPKAESAYK